MSGQDKVNHSHYPSNASAHRSFFLVYVFAKYLRYFIRPEYFLPSTTGDNLSQTQTDFFSSLSATENLTFVGQFRRDGTPPNVSLPGAIHEVPRMERLAFQEVVASSRVLLGIGLPGLSLTPYEALCLGVPFINPVEHWDNNDPEDRTKWKAQHDGLLHARVDEPYVYHVKVGDREGFERAIVKAMGTPIMRYVQNIVAGSGKAAHPESLKAYPEGHEMSALVRRIKALLETDWQPIAHRQIQNTGFRVDQ